MSARINTVLNRFCSWQRTNPDIRVVVGQLVGRIGPEQRDAGYTGRQKAVERTFNWVDID